MGSLARLARISTLAGSATLMSMEATVFYSRNDGPASESQKNCQFLEPKSAAAQECSKHDEEEDPEPALTTTFSKDGSTIRWSQFLRDLDLFSKIKTLQASKRTTILHLPGHYSSKENSY